jgi:acetyl-CoA synthetase
MNWKGEKMVHIPTFNAPRKYYELWRYSIEDPEGFWAEMAEKSMSDIYWFKKWDRVLERSSSDFKWFRGGRTNIGYNCVDYKLPRYKDKTAYIQESPELEISRAITYGELFDAVENYTAALRNLGLKRGDRVLFYIPNSIEAVTMLQACARMGAISTCVFAGFSPGALADRIELTKPKAIFTQDFTLRRERETRLKEAVDEALELCPREVAERVKFIIINPIEMKKVSRTGKRDILLAEFEERGKGGDRGYIELEANEPLLIMCTSGTTAKPKPVVHVHGGFQTWTYWTAKWVYGIKPEDVIFNTSDIGWIVGQSYLVFAPLLAGCSVILYEGTPNFPEPDMWWKIIEKHKATMLWTAPTGGRTLRGLGVEQAEKHDLASIERVVVAGEVLNPEVWSWMHKDVFKGKIPVFDHMWQTEIPGSMFGYPYGVKMPDIRPGSAGFPIPGVLPEIVDEREGKPCGVNEKGVLLLKEPVPGMTQTLWEDAERHRKEYWDTRPITKGRYFTGDLAYMDEDGYVWFCGRSDEVIKIAAHRIGPAEVESALISHPTVNEAAVCGVPDDLRGQAAVAFIVLKPGVEPSDDLKDELVRHVRKVMGPIVVFRGVEFTNSLPKTRSGKIMRRVMRKLWMGEGLGDLSTIETEASVDEIKDAISKLTTYGDWSPPKLP